MFDELERYRQRYLGFSAEEYRTRVSRLQERMVHSGMDGIIISQVENVLYFTGYRTWLKVSKHRPFVTVIPRSGEPILLVPHTQMGTAAAFSWIRDIRGWRDGEDYTALYGDVLREAHLDKARVGAELGEDTQIGMPHTSWQRLRAAMAGAAFVDASDLVWAVRAIKSPAEIEVIRSAAQLTSRAVEAAWRILRSGITEMDLLRSMNLVIADGCGYPYWMAVRTGHEMGMLYDKYATNRQLERGDLVLLDVGASIEDYCADMIRMAAVGAPTARQKELHELAVACNYACRDVIRPGVPLSEPVEVRNRFYRAHGLDVPPAPAVGHGIGLTGHELPRIRLGSEEVFQAGMVFTVEPGFSSTPHDRYVLEDMFVLTASGPEPLTDANRDLYVSRE